MIMDARKIAVVLAAFACVAAGRRARVTTALDGAPKGALVTWDPVAQQMRWRTPGGGGIGGGAVTTAGNLVFHAINDGRLVAGMGPPITYQIAGKQYVSVMGGMGLVAPRGGAAAGQGAGESSHVAEVAHVRAGWECSAAGRCEVREYASRYFSPDPVL
jgi:hypothetical protein